MIDISELWLRRVLLLSPVAGWLAFRFAKYIHRRTLRGSARVLTFLFTLSSAALVTLFLLFEIGCARHGKLWSPDGAHVLVISYTASSALDPDYANLYIRRRWSPFADLVYHGVAQWDYKHGELDAPKCRWLDNSRLLIRDYEGNANCKTRVGDVTILCENE